MATDHTGNVQPTIDAEEHDSKNTQAKKASLFGYLPGSDELVRISAEDAGGGEYVLKTSATISGDVTVNANTEYTEGDTDASITGIAFMWEDTSDTLRAVSAARPLPVSVTGGGDASAANQTTMIGHIDGIETLLGTIDTDTGNIASTLSDIDSGKLEESTFTGRVGEVQATPTANTLLGRLKDIDDALGGTITVDGSGATQPVSGTVTANLGATDNAVLDAIDAVLDTIKVDTEAIETAVEAIQAGQLADGHNVTVDNASIAVTNAGLTELAAAINASELDVNIASDSVGIGGGTQYDDADADATPTGTVAMGTDGSNVYALASDTDGHLQVDILSAPEIAINDGGNTITIGGTVDLGATDNAVLDAIAASVDAVDTNTDDVATATNQSTIIGHIDGIETLLGTIDADTSDIHTNTDTLAGAVDGSEMQVDIVTIPEVAINDGGNVITVDGAVTANLSATDNAVLDTIASNTEQRGSSSSVTAVADTASSTQLLASNADRLEATITNDSSADLYVKLGTTASATSYTVKLGQHETYIVDKYTGRIDGIWASNPDDGSARITEIT